MELTTYLTSQMPRAAGSGSYSVDGGPATTFEIPTWTSGFRGLPSNQTIRRVILFTTPVVSPGHHTVEITNLGNSETVPLAIEVVYVQHGDVDGSTAITLPPPVASGGGASQSISRMSTSSSSKSTGIGASTTIASAQKIPLGPIIGGGAGIFVVLATAGFLIYLCRKRRKEARHMGTESRLTSQEAQAWSMQSRNWTVASGLYRTGPTPPRYSMIPGDEHFITPFTLPTSTSSGPPIGVIPPENQRLLPGYSSTSLNRAGPSPSAIPTQPPPGYQTNPDGSQPANSSGRAGAAPPIPRRLPPRLPPLKGSDPRLRPDS